MFDANPIVFKPNRSHSLVVLDDMLRKEKANEKREKRALFLLAENFIAFFVQSYGANAEVRSGLMNLFEDNVPDRQRLVKREIQVSKVVLYCYHSGCLYVLEFLAQCRFNYGFRK